MKKEYERLLLALYPDQMQWVEEQAKKYGMTKTKFLRSLIEDRRAEDAVDAAEAWYGGDLGEGKSIIYKRNSVGVYTSWDDLR